MVIKRIKKQLMQSGGLPERLHGHPSEGLPLTCNRRSLVLCCLLCKSTATPEPVPTTAQQPGTADPAAQGEQRVGSDFAERLRWQTKTQSPGLLGPVQWPPARPCCSGAQAWSGLHVKSAVLMVGRCSLSDFIKSFCNPIQGYSWQSTLQVSTFHAIQNELCCYYFVVVWKAPWSDLRLC